jgi:ribosomal protein S14
MGFNPIRLMISLHQAPYSMLLASTEHTTRCTICDRHIHKDELFMSIRRWRICRHCIRALAVQCDGSVESQ